LGKLEAEEMIILKYITKVWCQCLWTGFRWIKKSFFWRYQV